MTFYIKGGLEDKIAFLVTLLVLTDYRYRGTRKMAIKDIFTMIKADRYTSDGREELIKAQEAVTEDVTYKPGDISRKTGLQKQPDGSWAPVKNAPGNKKPDGKSGSSEKHAKAMAHAEKVGVVSEVPTGWKKAEGVTTTPNGYVAITNGASRFPKEGEAKREIKFIKQEDFDKSASGALKEQTPEEIREIGRAGRAWRESLKKDAEERQREVQKALAEQMKKEANSSDIKIRGMDKDKYIFNTMMERHIPKEKAEESWNQEVERVQKLRAESSDAAPRILTGDCKIRIKKV